MTKSQIILKRATWLLLPLVVIAVLAIYVITTRPTTNLGAEVQTTAFVEQPPVISLVGASAEQDSLQFTISVSGLSPISSDQELSDRLCDPRITTGGIAQVSGFGYEITKLNGESLPSGWVPGKEPFEIHYYGAWTLAQPDAHTVPVHIDFTIGPCYPSFPNVTPVPNTNLVANYAVDFEVPVQ